MERMSRAGKPRKIRGGIPICFPQFGMMGPSKQQHGFVRNTQWEVEAQSEGQVTMVRLNFGLNPCVNPSMSPRMIADINPGMNPLMIAGMNSGMNPGVNPSMNSGMNPGINPKPCHMVLKYDGSGSPDFQQPFEIRSTVTLEESTLTQELRVTNTGSQALQFTCALHTYYQVADIRQVAVTGLQGINYLNNLEGLKESQEAEEKVTFAGEVDRVYVGVPGIINILDGGNNRTFVLARRGFPDAVVWNPWIAKAKSMADFGDEEYKEMLCVEPAVAASGNATVDPGETWSAQQVIKYSDA